MEKLELLLKEELNYTNTELLLIRYAILSILGELSKFLLLFLFFVLLSKTSEYMFAVTCLILLRSNSGGLHFKKYSKCFLFTLGILYTAIILLPDMVKADYLYMIPTLIFCALITFRLSPIQSDSKPPLPDVTIRKSKWLSFFFIFFYLIFMLYREPDIHMITGFWTITLQTLQLVVAYILQKGGTRNVKKN